MEKKATRSALMSPTHFTLMKPELFQQTCPARSELGDSSEQIPARGAQLPKTPSPNNGGFEEESEKAELSVAEVSKDGQQDTCEAAGGTCCEGPSKKKCRISGSDDGRYETMSSKPSTSKQLPPSTRHTDLQYDNNYKQYMAGRVAIATTKGYWDYQDDDESGEQAFERSVAARCNKWDKQMQFYNCVLNRPAERGEEKATSPNREVTQEVATSHRESEKIFPDGANISGASVSTDGDGEDGDELENDLDGDDCTEVKVIDLTGDTVARPAIAQETASDYMLAKVLQQELTGTSSANVSYSNDFEIARQLQQELDTETSGYYPHPNHHAAAAASSHRHHAVHRPAEDEDLSYERLLELVDVKAGLDRQAIQGHSITYNFVASSSAERKCCICLVEFEQGELLRSLPCMHVFHCPCIDKWLESNKLCPVCMKNITELAS